MPQVIAAAFVSLDGIMQAPGGPDEDRTGNFNLGGWTVPYWDDALGKHMSELFEEPFDLLLGRRTYDIFAAHWPRAAELEGEDGGIGKTFNAVTKHVATRTPATLAWSNSQWLGNDPAQGVRELKQGDGPRLLIQGSSVLIQTLLAHDLIDELRLLIYPLVLGRGKRLFEGGAAPAAFELLHSDSAGSGVFVARYRRAGSIRTGSFALD